MNKNLLNLALVVALTTFAQSSNTLLWKFYKKGQKPSYLYGTYHSKKITHDDYHDSLDVKITQVDRIYVEINEEERNKTATLMPSLSLPEGTTLKTLLKDAEYKRYVKFAKSKIGEAYQSFEKMNPLMVSLVFSMLEDMALEMDTSKNTVDTYIEKSGIKNNIEVKSLETAEEQFNALKEISIDESIRSLMETVDKFDECITLKAKLEKYYKNQDLKGIIAMTNDPEMKDDMEMLQGPLLDKRNKIMVDRAEKYIQESKKTVMIAVGAMHLIGKTGLIESFKAKGYTVEPVK